MIRSGTEKDYARCVELGFNFHQHAYGLHGVGYCTDSCLKTLELCHSHGLFVVAEIDGVVEGFCIGAKSPMMMNNSVTVGSELVWWVEPKHRSSGAGLALLKGIESAAKGAGVDVWAMVLLDSVDPEKVDKIYRKMGYSPAERSYIKRLQ